MVTKSHQIAFFSSFRRGVNLRDESSTDEDSDSDPSPAAMPAAAHSCGGGGCNAGGCGVAETLPDFEYDENADVVPLHARLHPRCQVCNKRMLKASQLRGHMQNAHGMTAAAFQRRKLSYAAFVLAAAEVTAAETKLAAAAAAAAEAGCSVRLLDRTLDALSGTQCDE